MLAILRAPALSAFLFVLLAASSARAALPPHCEDPACAIEPVVGLPDQTQLPAPTPVDQEPVVETVDGGVIEEVNCTRPGNSTQELLGCPLGDEAPDIIIRNAGRIDIQLFFISTNGTLQPSFVLRPGSPQRVGKPTCLGHRWMVQSLCGDCMAVIEVSSTDPEVIEVSNDGVELVCPPQQGSWSPVRQWQNDVVAAGLANIPGENRVIGFSSVQPGSFSRIEPQVSPVPRGGRTLVEIYDHVDDTFVTNNLEGHNMFCAALTLLPDGKLFAQGGGAGRDGRLVSIYDPFDGENGTWSRHHDTTNNHWYGTVVITAQQNLLLALGIDKEEAGFANWDTKLNFPEQSKGFNLSAPWTNMTGIDMDGKQPDVLHYYPFMHLTPKGDILESGPMNNMWSINTTGNGSISFAGKRNNERDEGQAWGASSIMFDAGKVLTIGGIENYGTTKVLSVLKRGYVIDMNNATNITTYPTEDMFSQRAFVNTVVLPSGEVVAIGGKNNTVQWDDTFSAKAVEMWNPLTNKWTVLAEHVAPRNYHAAAILLRDGRVMAAGGGLCGSCDEVDSEGNKLNQPSHEIFSPPYLFDRFGQLRGRPVIRRSTATTRPGRIIRIVVTGPKAAFIQRVSIVKQCAVTHSITTDARQLTLQIVDRIRRRDTKYIYKVRAHSNSNVMTPGYWFLFVLDGAGTPSVAADLRMVL